MYTNRERLEWVQNKSKESMKHLLHRRQESRSVELHEFCVSLTEKIIEVLGEILGKPEGTWDAALEELDRYILKTPGPKECFYEKQQARIDVRYARTGYYLQ
jgi:hypothetical protein